VSLIDAFTEYPESVGETYREHLLAALGFSFTLARAAVCCTVHACLPFLFTKTASAAVEELSRTMKRGRRASPAQAGHTTHV
jgi:hypothetical protein